MIRGNKKGNIAECAATLNGSMCRRGVNKIARYSETEMHETSTGNKKCGKMPEAGKTKRIEKYKVKDIAVVYNKGR